MGYWSTHPMGGDTPLNAQLCIEMYIEKQEGCILYSLKPPEKRELFEKYKYEIIENVNDILKGYEDCKFVLPFTFRMYDIRFKKEFLPRLQEMLGDGGSEKRYYSEEENDSPLVVANTMKKYINELFNEEICIEDTIGIIPKEEYSLLYDIGLLSTISKLM